MVFFYYNYNNLYTNYTSNFRTVICNLCYLAKFNRSNYCKKNFHRSVDISSNHFSNGIYVGTSKEYLHEKSLNLNWKCSGWNS